MICRILTGFICLFSIVSEAQVLRDTNFNHLYDPDTPFSFDWKVVNVENGFRVFYETRQHAADLNLSMVLETRGSLSEKNGRAIAVPPPTNESGVLYGSVNLPLVPEQNILVAKITISDQEKSKEYIYYKQLSKSKSLYLLADQRVVMNPFINTKASVTLAGFDAGKPIQTSCYRIPFPPAAPAFSNAQAKVSKTLQPDSIFTSKIEDSIELNETGLYLVQQDTSSAQGIAFRVENDYPKLGTIESLSGPLIYLCTRQEAEKLKQVGNDKKKFDQLVLSITGNADRARTFMRNYFKRVESANQYFSSYKEGWKTDRGMVYIIFGLPEEVYLLDDREVWDYKNGRANIRFQFTRSPSLFDPDNYVLIRDKKYTDTWYEMIDLWRKARF